MFEKTFKAMEDAFKSFENVFNIFNKEADKAVNNTLKNSVKIKIGNGSKVIINGAKCELLNSVTVMTNDPKKLMCK